MADVCLVSATPPPHAPGSAPEREVSVLRELRSVSAREGDGATFECTVSETETTGHWELGGRALRPGGRVRIRQEGVATFLPSVTPFYLAQDLGRLLPIQISSASSFPPHHPTAGVSGTFSAASSEFCLAPLPVLSPIPRADTSEPPRDLLGFHPHSRILPGSGQGLNTSPPPPPGKKHILVLSELRTEDTGEVCFQAGPAQSLARLEVEGKLLR